MRRAVITVTNPHRASVAGVTLDDLEFLDDEFAFENPNAEHVKRRAAMLGQKWAKGWDGRKHLFNIQTNSFPVGLLRSVKKALKTKNYKVKIVDDRFCATQSAEALTRVKPTMLAGVTLYDYQLEAVQNLLKYHGGIARLATGAGKTAVGAAFIKSLPNNITLYMVPNTKLITQTRKEVASFLGMAEHEIGMIQGGVYEPKQITIGIVNSLVLPKPPKLKPATKAQIKEALAEDNFDPVPTGEDFELYARGVANTVLAKRMAEWKARCRELKAYLASVQTVLFDECHHQASAMWTQVAKRLGATWRVGLSATPFDRTDGRSIMVEAACGPLVVNVASKQLIDRGILAKPRVDVYDIDKATDQDDNEVDVDGAYSEVYKKGIVRNHHFHQRVIKHTLRHVEKQRPTLVLVKEYEHAHALMQAFEDAGFGRAVFIHGSMSSDEFEDAKNNFAKGHSQVLVATPVMGEGQSIPEIRAMVIADDFESTILISQRIGRGLRKKKSGDNRLYVTEFAHMTHRYLADHSLTRIEQYEKEQFKVCVH